MLQGFQWHTPINSCNGPSLLGRDWLSHIRLDWAEIKTVNALGERKIVLQLLEKYSAVFAQGSSTMRHVQAHLSLKDGAQPRVHHPRPVPYAIKDLVGQELDRLEGLGVLCRVSHATWAALVVPVPKKDGTLRLCGDYKVTVNPELLVDQYPLPRPADLMACLTGGVCFSKLDLTAAYQQMNLTRTPGNSLP